MALSGGRQVTQGKHTPGPWRYAPTNTETVSHLVRCSEGYAVADVTHWFDLPADANARLIAAAPDMLEALEFIAGYAAMEPRIASDEVVIERARAAIAKATGDTQ